MKLITANKLNRFWKNGILPKLKEKLDIARVLKTTEEVEANTNEENVASAVVVSELINKLANGRVEIVVNNDGSLGYKLDGADTVYPFRVGYVITMSYILKATTMTGTFLKQKNGDIVITVDKGGNATSNINSINITYNEQERAFIAYFNITGISIRML